jgi:alkyldihydroxyacetonephosphate synthase
VLKAPGQLARLVALLEKQGRAHSRLLLLFENVESPADQARSASALCEQLGAQALGEAPVRQWLEHRYDVSFRQSKVFRAGAFSDTMEVAAPWSRLAAVYRSVKKAIGHRVLLMAHVSHCYPDGAAIYFTFVGHGRSQEQALALYDEVWTTALDAAVEAGACVSHHHGVGRSKARALARLSGAAARQSLRAAWDPDGILNPGVFGFPGDAGGDDGARAPNGASAPVEFDEVSQLADLDATLSLDQVENLLFKRGLTLGAHAAGDWRLGEWVLAGMPGLPSPWDDPVWRPIAGFLGRLSSGQVCELRAAPRRAEGPDLTAFFQGTHGALGRLERVTLAVRPLGVQVDPLPGPRPPAVSPTDAERRAFASVVRTLGRVPAAR